MAPFSCRVSTPSEIVGFLDACIRTCVDGEQGFALAAADVRAPSLKAYFRGKLEERADFVLALRGSVEEQRIFARDESSVGGAEHRDLVEVREAVRDRSDERVLEECLRGEIAALEAYAAASEHTPLDSLPAPVRSRYALQRKAIENTVAYLRRRLQPPALAPRGPSSPRPRSA